MMTRAIRMRRPTQESIKNAVIKLMLMGILLEFVTGIMLACFFAGEVYAIRNTRVSYNAGMVRMELDGQVYEHFAAGYMDRQ